jgi:hypothetical protein
MLLTHLVEKNPEYRQWAASAKRYKILDNSLIELGSAVNMQRILRAAEEVGANEIILPDVFRNGEATLREVFGSMNDIASWGHLGKYKLMAVCQGKDEEEFARTFEILSQQPSIDVIGIPKVCAKMHPAGRPHFEYLWEDCPKTIHLLGLWYSWTELEAYEHPEDIRSVDTCLAAFQAKYHLSARAVRPDGFSVDLGDNTISSEEIAHYITRR